jgi:hypothetical protein
MTKTWSRGEGVWLGIPPCGFKVTNACRKACRSYKAPLLSDFYQTLNVSTDGSKISQYQILWKFLSGSRDFTSGLTDRQTWRSDWRIFATRLKFCGLKMQADMASLLYIHFIHFNKFTWTQDARSVSVN